MINDADEQLEEAQVGMLMPNDTDLFEKRIDPCDVTAFAAHEARIERVVRVSHVEHIMTSMCFNKNELQTWRREPGRPFQDG
jgi:hypothetical protein